MLPQQSNAAFQTRIKMDCTLYRIIPERGGTVRVSTNSLFKIVPTGQTKHYGNAETSGAEAGHKLKSIVDGVFADFMSKLKGDNFELFGEPVSSVDMISALNSSEPFRALTADMLFAADVPVEKMNKLATFMGYLVFAGYLARGAETLGSLIGTLM